MRGTLEDTFLFSDDANGIWKGGKSCVLGMDPSIEPCGICGISSKFMGWQDFPASFDAKLIANFDEDEICYGDFSGYAGVGINTLFKDWELASSDFREVIHPVRCPNLTNSTDKFLPYAVKSSFTAMIASRGFAPGLWYFDDMGFDQTEFRTNTNVVILECTFSSSLKNIISNSNRNSGLILNIQVEQLPFETMFKSAVYIFVFQILFTALFFGLAIMGLYSLYQHWQAPSLSLVRNQFIITAIETILAFVFTLAFALEGWYSRGYMDSRTRDSFSLLATGFQLGMVCFMTTVWNRFSHGVNQEKGRANIFGLHILVVTLCLLDISVFVLFNIGVLSAISSLTHVLASYLILALLAMGYYFKSITAFSKTFNKLDHANAAVENFLNRILISMKYIGFSMGYLAWSIFMLSFITISTFMWQFVFFHYILAHACSAYCLIHVCKRPRLQKSVSPPI